MLPYAAVCCRMLTYADVCGRWQRVMAPEQRRRVPLFDTDAMVRALHRLYRMLPTYADVC